MYWISLLYQLEANLQAENATPERVAAERQAKALPIMDAMDEWMKTPQRQPISQIVLNERDLNVCALVSVPALFIVCLFVIHCSREPFR